MATGVFENGIFYFGAREKPFVLPLPSEEVQVYEPEPTYDADASEVYNARRYFGFSDHEEIDIFLLRSRRLQRKGHPQVDYWYSVLLPEVVK